MLSIEEYDISHVQGALTTDHRIKDEGNNKNLSIALVGVGKPMALGIADVLSGASSLHARPAANVKREIIMVKTLHVSSWSTVSPTMERPYSKLSHIFARCAPTFIL
jgi:hypothetical protein